MLVRNSTILLFVTFGPTNGEVNIYGFFLYISKRKFAEEFGDQFGDLATS